MELNRVVLLIAAVIGLTQADLSGGNDTVIKGSNNYHCPEKKHDVATEYWRPVCYIPKCTNRIKKHVAIELNAAFHYLYMAAHFDQYSVNRPGIAKFMYESASEEREHGILMMDYLNFRGIPMEENYYILQHNVTATPMPTDLNYKSALTTALIMEIDVTDAIHKIVRACDKDFHSADKFTDPILEEQHTGVRKIQGLLKEFDDMTRGMPAGSHDIKLAEYIFDKKMMT